VLRTNHRLADRFTFVVLLHLVAPLHQMTQSRRMVLHGELRSIAFYIMQKLTARGKQLLLQKLTARCKLLLLAGAYISAQSEVAARCLHCIRCTNQSVLALQSLPSS
jgi:hypothetical protein